MIPLITLTELRSRYVALFHPNQDWFVGERFMTTPLPRGAPTGAPIRLVKAGVMPTNSALLPLAVTLAVAYIGEPKNPIWRGWMWCQDVDQYGQRIFIGTQGRGLEIHRQLAITARWGTPVWS